MTGNRPAGTVALSVVIPAYDEAGRIGRTLAELRRELPSLVSSWEVRVVDDGSRDETGAIVEGIARDDSRVVLQREPHRGKGGAVRAGMLGARGDLRFLCDADLSMPVRELARFLELVPSAADIAIGSREGAEAHRVGEPARRHLMGRVFNRLVQITLLPGIEDTQCGFKLFTANAAEMVFPWTTIDGWAFDIEVLHIARLRGFRVREVPIEWHYGERSRVSMLSDPLRMIRDVWRIRRNERSGVYTRPTGGSEPVRLSDTRE